MRGPSKSLPKYAKHKASGKAVVRLNGTDVYLGPHGTIEFEEIVSVLDRLSELTLAIQPSMRTANSQQSNLAPPWERPVEE